MSLADKNITALRGIAQAMGIKFKWSDSRPQLLLAIENEVNKTIEPLKKGV